jgi:hypothetical protein
LPCEYVGVRPALLIWLCLSALGTAILVVPDDDERLLSLSENHGFAALDLVGAGVLLVAWLFPIVGALQRRTTAMARRASRIDPS